MATHNKTSLETPYSFDEFNEVHFGGHKFSTSYQELTIYYNNISKARKIMKNYYCPETVALYEKVNDHFPSYISASHKPIVSDEECLEEIRLARRQNGLVSVRTKGGPLGETIIRAK